MLELHIAAYPMCMCESWARSGDCGLQHLCHNSTGSLTPARSLLFKQSQGLCAFNYLLRVVLDIILRFPARGKTGGDAKVPTVIYYDSNGVPQVIGAETEKEGLETIAEDSQWVKVEW